MLREIDNTRRQNHCSQISTRHAIHCDVHRQMSHKYAKEMAVAPRRVRIRLLVPDAHDVDCMVT